MHLKKGEQMVNKEALKRELDKRNMSVEDLSDLTGVDRSTIYRILSGSSKCNVETATKIVNKLRLKPSVAMTIFFEE